MDWTYFLPVLYAFIASLGFGGLYNLHGRAPLFWASAGGAVSLESRTEINVSGASSPDEVARRVAVEQDNINADLIRYAQGAAR